MPSWGIVEHTNQFTHSLLNKSRTSITHNMVLPMRLSHTATNYESDWMEGLFTVHKYNLRWLWLLVTMYREIRLLAEGANITLAVSQYLRVNKQNNRLTSVRLSANKQKPKLSQLEQGVKEGRGVQLKWNWSEGGVMLWLNCMGSCGKVEHNCQ